MSYALGERDNQIIKYLPLVKKVVGRIDVRGSDYDQDDLFSIGVIGLMDAIEKFDHSKNVPFEAYANLRIRGSIIDELRKTGRVSRDKIDKLNQYYNAKETLENKLLRTPEEWEICKELGIDDKQLSKIHETVHFLSTISLESSIFSNVDNDIQLMDTVKDYNTKTPEEEIIDNEQRKLLAEAISKLDERERIILNLYYNEELSLKEIAYILDISIPRVSQLHGKILLKLRGMISSSLEEDWCFIF